MCDFLTPVLIGGWLLKQPGFFEVEERPARSGGPGDQLEAFSRTVNFEAFRPDLEKALAYSELRNAGYLPMFGQILDATLVAAPRQGNTNAKKADLRTGRIPEGWEDKPARLSHKDRHARWTLKFTKEKRQEDGTMPSTDLAIPFPGYKSHISIDRKFRRIRKWKTTDATASDGARLREGLLDKANTPSSVWADTAYRSKANEGFMDKEGCVSKLHRKKPHLKHMPRHIRRSNARKSVIRSRIAHVFADQKSQTGLFVRTVGITRATMRIGLANIVYNMHRFLFLERFNAAT